MLYIILYKLYIILYKLYIIYKLLYCKLTERKKAYKFANVQMLMTLKMYVYLNLLRVIAILKRFPKVRKHRLTPNRTAGVERHYIDT